MCGIAGYYAWGDARPHPKFLQALWYAQQSRGMDAAGIAYMDEDRTIRIIKRKGPVSELIRDIADTVWEEIATSPRVICHARATTKGKAENNANNHPVHGLGWVVTHNGVLLNDDDLWGYYTDTPRFAEVDTSAIPLVLAKGREVWGDPLAGLTLMSGAATIAAWEVAQPDTLILARLGHNALYLFLDERNGILYWSSAAMAGRIMPARVVGKTRFLLYSQLGDGRALVLEPSAPFGGRSFRLERRPFVVPRRSSASPVGSTTSPTASAVTSSGQSTGTDGECNVRVAHPSGLFGKVLVESLDPTLPTMPALHLPPPEKFSWYTHDLKDAETKVRGRNTSLTLYTAMGRWILTPDTSAPMGVKRLFRHFKAWKKWWRRTTLKGLPCLPVTLRIAGDSIVTAYDDPPRSAFQVIATIPPSHEGGAFMQHLGWLCPWCGIWANTRTWVGWGARCAWCNIKPILGERKEGT